MDPSAAGAWLVLMGATVIGLVLSAIGAATLGLWIIRQLARVF
jgi:hypothetical protein